MEYPNCKYRCNGMLNCKQMDTLISGLIEQNGREDTTSIYTAILKRNFQNCPLKRAKTQTESIISMY